MPNNPPRLPNELVLWIAKILESQDQRETLSTLAQTSRSTWRIVTPILYQQVTIPTARAFAGVIANFGTRALDDYHDITFLGRARGLYLLNHITHLTLGAIPQVDRVWGHSPTSNWHKLKSLAHHHHLLSDMKNSRMIRLVITKEAVSQLEPIELNPGTHVEKVIMPSDGLPPLSTDAELSFFPQGAFPLQVLISLRQPRHFIIHIPFRHSPSPSDFPTTSRTNLSRPTERYRPHEWNLRRTLSGLIGKETTLCAHGLVDQVIPIGSMGAKHYISFTAHPTTQPAYEVGVEAYPCVAITVRISLIAAMIRRSNPVIPDEVACVGSSTIGGLDQWEESDKGSWTIYRPGAMVTASPRRWEWTFGEEIERRVREWVRWEYTVDKGHPEDFAESINKRLKSVHCGLEDEPDPESLTCGSRLVGVCALHR
jgi:hypothetical protein